MRFMSCNLEKQTVHVVSRLVLVALALVLPASVATGVMGPTDPGVRPGAPGAGGPIPGLTSGQRAFFLAGQEAFEEVVSVRGTEPGAPDAGLGPRFNLNQCSGCHLQPAIGGSSPRTNPQVAMAARFGADNYVPYFVAPNGPIREARFKYYRDGSRDGNVHQLFVITGRYDASGCRMTQPGFEAAAAARNISLRIPTPVFGDGLIEEIQESTILANATSNSALKRALGISGHENRDSQDGLISRFGWKAQITSTEVFAGRAYNAEMGVTNELSQNELDETFGCVLNATPEDQTDFDANKPLAVVSDTVLFAHFMRFLAPPQPANPTFSTKSGAALFVSVGCALCHTPSMNTGPSSVAALSRQTANLYSDLLVHNMGKELSDDIVQGRAGPDEFRTAPLWGAGQRIFFLHDGRTSDILQAIQAHASDGSEANAVVGNFNRLSVSQRQDILNFLRSL